MRSINVQITAQVWLDEQEIERLMQENGLTEQQAIEAHAAEKASKAVPSDEHAKVRDIVVQPTSLQSHD